MNDLTGRIVITAGTLRVDVNAAGHGRIEIDGRPVAVSGLTLDITPGKGVTITVAYPAFRPLESPARGVPVAEQRHLARESCR